MKYCLDTNVFIEAWQKYYRPGLCPGYWDVLNELGKEEMIFIPVAVFDEVAKTEDELSKWLEASDIPVKDDTVEVIQCLKEIYDFDPSHLDLVDNKRGRSLADPWVIAHALAGGAVVVTKEDRITSPLTKKIAIPNVCDNMNIIVMNDFELLQKLNIRFSCSWMKSE